MQYPTKNAYASLNLVGWCQLTSPMLAGSYRVQTCATGAPRVVQGLPPDAELWRPVGARGITLVPGALLVSAAGASGPAGASYLTWNITVIWKAVVIWGTTARESYTVICGGDQLSAGRSLGSAKPDGVYCGQ